MRVRGLMPAMVYSSASRAVKGSGSTGVLLNSLAEGAVFFDKEVPGSLCFHCKKCLSVSDRTVTFALDWRDEERALNEGVGDTSGKVGEREPASRSGPHETDVSHGQVAPLAA